MAEVRVRHFDLSPPTPDSPIEPEHVHLVKDEPLELNMAEVLRVNAMAVPYRGRLLMRLVSQEMALVMSLFGSTPPGSPLTRHEAFDNSSLHIRRFATEVLALGGLTAVVREHNAVLDDVAHFDALPKTLKTAYPSGGTRPDLRFAGAGSVLAGEARGRSQSPPISALTSSGQRRRLTQLLAWSRQPGCDPVCMAWSWMQPHQTVVDFFRFTADTSGLPAEVAVVEELEAIADTAESPVPQAMTSAPPPKGRVEDGPAVRSRERTAKQRVIHKTIRDREQQLIETAPRRPVPGMRKTWLGQWQQVPLTDGAWGPNILLAVTPDDRGPRRSTATDPNRLDSSRQTGLEVSADGRTMVAVDWRARPENEAGAEVEQILE